MPSSMYGGIAEGLAWREQTRANRKAEAMREREFMARENSRIQQQIEARRQAQVEEERYPQEQRIKQAYATAAEQNARASLMGQDRAEQEAESEAKDHKIWRTMVPNPNSQGEFLFPKSDGTWGNITHNTAMELRKRYAGSADAGIPKDTRTEGLSVKDIVSAGQESREIDTQIGVLSERLNADAKASMGKMTEKNIAELMTRAERREVLGQIESMKERKELLMGRIQPPQQPREGGLSMPEQEAPVAPAIAPGYPQAAARGPLGETPPPAREPIVQQVPPEFEAYDADKSGTLDAKEQEEIQADIAAARQLIDKADTIEREDKANGTNKAAAFRTQFAQYLDEANALLKAHSKVLDMQAGKRVGLERYKGKRSNGL